VKIGDNRDRASTKLDVLTSKQFNRLAVINLSLMIYTIALTAIYCGLCNSVWKRTHKHKTADGKEVDLGSCLPSQLINGVFQMIDIIGRCTIITVCVVFTVRIIRTKVPRTPEQLWTVGMIVMTAISFNPGLPIVIFHDYVLTGDIYFPNNDGQWSVLYPWIVSFMAICRGATLVVSSVGQIFYIWACAHSFGILDAKDRPSRLRFYGPRILILIIYNISHLGLVVFGIAPSKLPFSTFFALVAYFRQLKTWDTKIFLIVSAVTLLEFMIMIAIFRRMRITTRVLREAQYVKHRSKQIGFRFFVWQNIISYGLFLASDTAVLLLIPRGEEITNDGTGGLIKYMLYNVGYSYVVSALSDGLKAQIEMKRTTKHRSHLRFEA